jgi:group I intron endonuclease
MAKSQACGIYMIIHNVGGEYYIGQSKNIFSRWSEHFRHSKTNAENSILYKAIQKYGITAFQFKILELCDESELDEKEKFYIALYESTKNHNYNIQSGGTGGSSIGINNGNSKLTDEDVFNIRERYKQLKRKKDVYQDYQHLISINTFSDVWIGKTWKHIHMDVYTEDIKRQQRNNYDRIKSHKYFQILSDDDILKIRQYKKEGQKPNQVYLKYYPNINRNTFNDVWYNHTFKHIIA